MSRWQQVVMNLGDQLFGWTLTFARDFTLLTLAAFTIIVLIGVRAIFADQKALSRLIADEQRLKQLHTDASSTNDDRLQQRCRSLRRLLAGQRARCELGPALIGVLPALMVMTWGARHLEYDRLLPDDGFVFSAIFPTSFVSQHVHVVPQAGLEAETGWIQIVRPMNSAEACGYADWKLVARRPGAMTITARHSYGNMTHPFSVGAPNYERPELRHGDEIDTTVRLQLYRPFGVVPPVRWLGLQPWAVAFLILVASGYLTTRCLLRMN